MGGYTGDFALVGEGVTDHAVLKTILLGYFKGGHPREPRIRSMQPDRDPPPGREWQEYGNWENVFRYLREGHHQGALQFNKYLVIQIDTDCSEHPNFGVPRYIGGAPVEVPVLVERVIERIRLEIGEEDCRVYGDRLLFAVCVDSMECWLLPLWADQEIHQRRTTGCLEALNRELARQNQYVINPSAKEVATYQKASKGYRKRKELMEHGRKSPSLGIFLEALEARGIVLEPDE